MKSIIFVLIATFYLNAKAQETQKIFTSDIDNFWMAYDSIQKVKDFNQQLSIINDLYIHKGTKGLKAFMEVRNYNDTLWVKLIQLFPKFWNSVRPNTLQVQTKSDELERGVFRFKTLYPELKDANMYFTIGGLSTGGTTSNNLVLIGTEIAAADSLVDVSEFKNKWLQSVFKKQNINHIVFLNIHEYVHTQQKGNPTNVLSASIKEGACDFMAELITEQTLSSQYLFYGISNEPEIKELFKKDMLTGNYNNWLSNGPQMGEKADLGYFVGYKICKSYYETMSDKAKAIKTIVELNYSDEKYILEFLKKSNYLTFETD